MLISLIFKGPHCSDFKSSTSKLNNILALTIFDHFSGQLTERAKNVLESSNILFGDVPPNCTDQLQPMDITTDISIKASLKNSFSGWYADQKFKGSKVITNLLT